MKVIKMTGTNCTTVCEGRSIDYLAVHYSAGTDCSPGKAKDLISWFRNPQADGSADYVADEGDLYQYNPDPYNRYCHAVGGGRYNTKGGRLYGVASNKNCISLEIVSGNRTGKITYPNDPNYYFTDAVIAKAKEAVQYLMKLYKIDADHIIRHYDVNGKCCPGIIGWNADSGSETEWNAFHASIGGSEVHLYRVRLKWELPGTQIGAYYILDNAKDNCPAGYSIYDENGKLVWTNTDSVSSAQPGKYPKGIPASKEAYIEACGAIARDMYAETAILPSVVTAQCCLETGFGLGSDSVELMKVNNLLGMKTDLINGTWKDYTVWDGQSISKLTPEYHNGKLVYITDSFRAYKDYENCIRDYEMFLLHVKNDKGYKYRRIQGWTDPKEVIHAIRIGTGTDAHPEGYCTDPAYETKILALIDQYNLRRFDTQTEQPKQEEPKQEEKKVSKPKTIIDCMKIFQKQMREDIKSGKVWRYYNSKVSGTFDAAEKNENLRANCATIANWCLRKLKVFKRGNYFWGRLGGTLACTDATLAVLKANCRLIHVNGKKTVGQLIKDGTLQAGDIVTYMDIQHTNVYAGDGWWYDAGHAYCKSSETGEGAKFRTWYGETVYSDQRVAYIIRYKGNATPEPKKQTVYRVQVGAYNKKTNADKRVAEVAQKSGFPCFQEQTDMIRVYCGSFESQTNAKARVKDLKKAGIKEAIIVEVK